MPPTPEVLRWSGSLVRPRVGRPGGNRPSWPLPRRPTSSASSRAPSPRISRAASPHTRCGTSRTRSISGLRARRAQSPHGSPNCSRPRIPGSRLPILGDRHRGRTRPDPQLLRDHHEPGHLTSSACTPQAPRASSTRWPTTRTCTPPTTSGSPSQGRVSCTTASGSRWSTTVTVASRSGRPSTAIRRRAWTKQTQADRLRDFIVTWRTLDGAGPAFVYTTRDRNTGSSDSQDNYGVYRTDWTPKPAADVMRSLA